MMPTDEKNAQWMGQVCTLYSTFATTLPNLGSLKYFPSGDVERLHFPAGPPDDTCVVKAVLADRVAVRWDNPESVGRLNAGADKHWEYPNLQKLRDEYALQPLQSDKTSTAV